MKNLPSSTRPYLIRAMHEWCEDNGFTAYVAVAVDASVRVPRQHVVDGEIVLNASVDATGSVVVGQRFH
jgi:stringent starvation protein B